MAGLALAPLAPEGATTQPLAFGLCSLAALALLRPRLPERPVHTSVWLGLVVLAAAACGVSAGAARLAAIDSGAMVATPGDELIVEGHVAAVPRREDGELEVRIDTAAGRLLVRAVEPAFELDVGAEIRARGTIREPAEWEAGYLRRLGIARILEARALRLTGDRRTGFPGALDSVRTRAEGALGRGTGDQAAALLRGFVLGQDDRIDPTIVDEFKRSGLAHLLAVSGQNVLLLAVLVAAVLALCGVGLRARLLWILALIAIYVPVAGGGASIQRAGVMGAAGVIAALVARPSSRWYALGLAAALTLGLNPRASADVGWQLSFAAVIGIFLLYRPLRALIGGGERGVRAALADGAALTIAATLATAPLMAFQFGSTSLVALPANLIAAPAVAPVMWLGMLSAGLGQVAWVPVEPLTWIAGALAGYIAQVAAWFAAPSWSLAEVELGGAVVLVAIYAALGATVVVAIRAHGRRRRVRLPRGLRAVAIALCVGATAFGLRGLAGLGEDPSPPPVAGMRLTVLDVGQGDAILIEPAGREPILVDTGLADAGVAELLAGRGIDHLDALVATHPEEDHIGGAGDVLGHLGADRLIFSRIDRTTLAAGRDAGALATRVAAGDRWRSGPARFEVLWPPAQRLDQAMATAGPRTGDPNALAVVLLVRCGSFTALLSADAETELAPVSVGPIDVLKVAHHGSDDAGLASLLSEAKPQLAVISVGAENTYGHPTAATLATLAAAGATTARTDRDGDVVVEVEDDGWQVR